MSASRVNIIGGIFQDSEGNVLANGYLKFVLSQDAMVNDSQICAGIAVTIQLDGSGSISTSPDQYIWGNDQMSPANTFYTVTGYTAEGQPAWGPNNQQVTGSGGTFDVGSWVPNQIVTWTPSIQATEIEVDGVALINQTPVNFQDTATITWANPSAGIVKASVVSSPTPAGENIVPIIWTYGTEESGSAENGTTAFPTAVTIFPAASIQSYPSYSKITINVQSGSSASAVGFGAIVLARTLPGSLSVVDFTPITFGGSPTPTLALGYHTSDSIALQIDAAHDYYFMAWSSYPQTGVVTGLNASGAGYFGGNMGDGTSNLTSTSPIQNPTVVNQKGSWVARWQSA